MDRASRARWTTTALSVLLALYIMKVTSTVSTTQVCTSRQCLRSAGDLAESMDTTVDPCDNFHQYVCGNWPNMHPKPDSDMPNNWFIEKQYKVYALVRDTLSQNTTSQPKPVQQARDFYASCMDTGSIEKIGVKGIFDVLKSVNLPMLPTILNISGAELPTYKFDWLDTVIKIKTKLDMHVLFGFVIHPINKSENIVIMRNETTDRFPRSYKKSLKVSNHIRQISGPLMNEEPVLRLDLNLFGLEDTPNALDEKKYRKQTIEEDTLPTSDSDEYKLIEKYVKESGVKKEIDTILHESIIQSLKHYKRFNDETSAQESVNITNIIKNFLQPYITRVFNDSRVMFDFSKDQFNYTTSFISIVKSALSAPPEVIELYIWMKVVTALDKHIRTERKQRSLQCSMMANELLGMAVSYALVESDIFNVTKPKILKMIDEIKKSLHESIRNAQWMDDKTKQVTYEKISDISSLVGIPEWFYEPGKLEEYYEGLEISRDNYWKNLLNTVQARLIRRLNKFREPNYFLWAFDPSVANAGYFLRKNSITIPMVMMQYPFFDLGLESLNYGHLGHVLGHEITHGFDNNGRLLDKDGNIVQWWSDDSIGKYVNLSQCFVNQYSSYCVSEIHKHVNGSQTLSENIADNGGLNQALAALKRHLQENGPEEKLPGFELMSSEQMFFLSLAHTYCDVPTVKYLADVVQNDEHTPAEFRIRGMLQNSEEFAKAWNCPLGSPMNPRGKCKIF